VCNPHCCKYHVAEEAITDMSHRQPRTGPTQTLWSLNYKLILQCSDTQAGLLRADTGTVAALCAGTEWSSADFPAAADTKRLLPLPLQLV